jgi:hypothetical protein
MAKGDGQHTRGCFTMSKIRGVSVKEENLGTICAQMLVE